MPFSRAGQLARPVPTARLTDSIGLVAENLRTAPHGVLPVLDRVTFGEGDPTERPARVIGLIDARDLARAVSAHQAAVPVSVPVFDANFAPLETVGAGSSINGGANSQAHPNGQTYSNGNGSALAEVSEAPPKPWTDLTARDVMRGDVPHVPSAFTLQNALMTFDRYDLNALPVLDEKGYYRGIVSRADVLAAMSGTIRPPMVGGMATPLGVWLSNGVLDGGAPKLGLFLSGLVLAACLVASTVILTLLLWSINPSYGAAALSGRLGIMLDGSGGINSASFVLHSGFFLLSFRLLPMAGVHAAEHQTVHALERGLPLEIQYVEKMPRAHPRCGTNLIVLLGLVTIGLMHLPDLTPDWILGVLIFTFFTWRNFGTLVQEHFTTRRATKKQLEGGIKAAKELMEKYQAQPFAAPSSPLRLLNSGMVYSFLGVMLGVNGLLWGINWIALRLIS